MAKRIDVTRSEYCDFRIEDFFEAEHCPDVVVFGNRDFVDFNTEGLFSSLQDHADEAAEDLADFLAGDGYSWYHSVNDIINDYFDFPVDLTPTQYGEIFKLLHRFTYSRYITLDDFTLSMYEIIFRKKYTFGTLRGYCQRDWMNILYPVNERDIFEAMEGIYFTGSEYGVDVYSDDDTCNTFYAFYWQDVEDIKTELSADYDCPVDNIHVYDITGYTTTPNYAEVF